ncbi:glycerophosphodiester phosphodiesterase family protein [Bacillus gobiensis]|uniref:glycerophosphodiester phosphodiesterase n=1 Tax=Bacillus gobiensis TaxID=1441095 RepID=UPI003D22A877
MKIIAHRGASGYAPENTLAAFDLAVEMGADFIEFDIRMTKDFQLAVIHDDTVDRITNGSGFVKDYTMSELSQLDAGSWFGNAFAGETIHQLEAVLTRYSGKIGMLIEIKDSALPHDLLVSIGKAIELFPFNSHTVVQSFHRSVIHLFNSMFPSIPTALLVRPRFGMISKKRLRSYKSFVGYVNPKYTLVNPNLIRAIHQAGLKSFVWTLRSKKAIERISKLPIDGVITDYPDYFIGRDGRR